MNNPNRIACLIAFVVSLVTTFTSVRADEQPTAVPDWLFPVDPSVGQPRPAFSDAETVSIPGSDVSYTPARVNDPFNAPDWHPDKHEPMPPIVARGRAPDVIACAYCHTPTGQGRPENSALAGLSATYIAEQLRNMRDGTRRKIGPESYLPIRNMIRAAKPMTDAEIAGAAEYFSKQTLGVRVDVVETSRIPKVVRAGWVYARDPLGGEENLGERIIEVTPDIVRHERRDDRMIYTAYVPAGSIARGKSIATDVQEPLRACSSCHGPMLHGTDLGPPLAGRSPTYLMRQLLAFQQKTRSTPQAAAMENVVADFDLSEMISVAAYAASLAPTR